MIYTEFNWYDITTKVKDPNSQLILCYCELVGKNVFLGKDYTALVKRLNLEYVQKQLFEPELKYLIQKDDGIYSHYITDEPQCYFNNSQFLFGTSSVQEKVDYLHILSQRPIGANRNWIPSRFIKPQYYNNIFIQKKHDRINLPMENINGERMGNIKKTKRPWWK